MGIKITELADSGSTVVLGADLLLTVDLHSSPTVTRKVTVADLFTSYPISPFDPTARGGVTSVIHKNAGTGATPGSTVETDLMTFTLPANNVTVGNQVGLKTWGTSTGTGGGATIRLYYGPTVITSATITSSNSVWKADGSVINIDSSGSEAIGTLMNATAVVDIARNLSSARSTAAIIVRVTGQKSASTGVDLTAQGFVVDFAS